MYGNDPSPLFNGKGTMDVTVPGYIVSLVIGTTGFLSLPIALAVYRERGILRRFRVTPLGPGWVLGSQGLVNLAATLVGTLILILAGVIIYHLHLPENPLAVLAGFLLVCLSTFATGMIIASLVKTASAARAVGMVVYYPMMFLSGGTLPRELMPETLKRISGFFPLTYGVDLFKSLWFGNGWNSTNVAVMLGTILVGGVLCVLLFRWE
jgi:ABC-2 type transport system permease protein